MGCASGARCRLVDAAPLLLFSASERSDDRFCPCPLCGIAQLHECKDSTESLIPSLVDRAASPRTSPFRREELRLLQLKFLDEIEENESCKNHSFVVAPSLMVRSSLDRGHALHGVRAKPSLMAESTLDSSRALHGRSVGPSLMAESSLDSDHALHGLCDPMLGGVAAAHWINCRIT